jgi:hypothetical protein
LGLSLMSLMEESATMPRRKIELKTKVQVMREILHVAGVKAVLEKHGVSERAVFSWYERVLEALPEILADETPGRKAKPKAAKESVSPPAPAPPF